MLSRFIQRAVVNNAAVVPRNGAFVNTMLRTVYTDATKPHVFIN
jgi:hypothetical protein